MDKVTQFFKWVAIPLLALIGFIRYILPMLETPDVYIEKAENKERELQDEQDRLDKEIKEIDRQIEEHEKLIGDIDEQLKELDEQIVSGDGHVDWHLDRD